MNPFETARSAGLLVTPDSIDVLHCRLASGVPERVRRFSSLIKEVLLANTGKASMAAASLVAIDGVRPSQLPLIQKSMFKAYQWKDMSLIEWYEESPPRYERRAISVHTQKAIANCQNLAAIEADLTDSLKDFLSHASEYRKFRPKDRLKELEQDAMCWWYQCLPITLFFHLSGLQTLSVVSRLCLAREQTQKIPILPLSIVDTNIEGDVDSCSEMLDVAAISSAKDLSLTLVRRAVDLMKSDGAETDGVARRRWVVELLALRADALQAGPITSLLIAWLIDLCESGTLRSNDPSKETPRRYFSKAGEPLLIKLRDLSSDPGNWTGDQIETAYQDLIDDELIKNPGGASAKLLATAINSFHSFLVEWLDAPQLRRQLHRSVPEIPVRANIVWDHEIERAIQWVPHLVVDPQIQVCLAIALGIARAEPVRVTEILLIRIGNISKDDAGLEIEIAPSLKFGRLKSSAAQRRVRVSDLKLVEMIWSWRLERKAAGAGDDALLFADPMDASIVYRRHTTSRLLTHLLRAATGDPTTVAHDMRHTALSVLNEPVLVSTSIGNINRLAENSLISGHVTAATSLRHYTHIYESALRIRLDAALVMQVPITSNEAATILKVSSAAIRKKASRNGSATDEYAWQQIREADQGAQLETASSAWHWSDPVPPDRHVTNGLAHTVSISRLILESVLDRHSSNAIASRFMRTQGEIESLRDSAINVADEVARYMWPQRFSLRTDLPIGFEEALTRCGINDLGDANQEKYSRLKEWLASDQELPIMEQGFRSWLKCRRGDVLSLDMELQALPLLRMLASASVNPTALRICVRANSLGAPIDPRALENAERCFVVAFGMKPRVLLVKARAWTANTYLQWDSTDCISKPHAVSGSIRGLDAWMLCIGAHIKSRL